MIDENNKPADSAPSKSLLMVALYALAILGLAACDDPSSKPEVPASSPKPTALESTPKPVVPASSPKLEDVEPTPTSDDDGGANGCTTVCTNHLKQITISPGRYACVAC